MGEGVSPPQGYSQQRQQGQLGASWKGLTETHLVINLSANGGFTVTELLRKLREALYHHHSCLQGFQWLISGPPPCN